MPILRTGNFTEAFCDADEGSCRDPAVGWRDRKFSRFRWRRVDGRFGKLRRLVRAGLRATSPQGCAARAM